MMTAEELLRLALAGVAAQRSLPESTYRLQFHAGFTFRDASVIVPYLHDLGITHCYASPYLKARPGSLHGYDIIDHHALNPEIGTVEDHDAWVAELHAHGMGLILDIVPNHMGIAGNGNAWWNDVMENGPSSPFAGYFDIAWQDSPRPELNNRVLLPVLGDFYGKVLEAGQIRLCFEAGGFFVQYFDHRFPVAPHSYAIILGQELEALERVLGADSQPLHEFKSILTAVGHLPGREETAAARIEERQREKEIIKRRLAALVQECAAIRESLDAVVERFNGKAGDAHSFDLLDRLLGEQAYRLSHWRVASDEINYRRFFDVNELAALNTEKPEVFAATHELILDLLRSGKVDGLRVDHVDGLFDPKQYLRRLQQHYLLARARAAFDAGAGPSGAEWKTLEAPLLERITETMDKADVPPLFVIVEKILAATEDLPADWPTHGTSGYDFLNVQNGLFVAPLAREPLTRFYREWTGDDTRLDEIVFEKKYLILRDALASESHMLGRQLDRLAQKKRRSRDFTNNSLRFVLRQIIASFPVYRSYISAEGVHDSDRACTEIAVRRAMRRNPTVSPALFRFVRDTLLAGSAQGDQREDLKEPRQFAGKFQQVTSPVMAKGVEDTAFYVYNRFLSLNEVGGDPSRFGITPESVHRYNQTRQARWPHSLSPLSTHDTKRSEDVRARLNVLSELPEQWRECVVRWSELNKAHRTIEDGTPIPDANEEYLIYQTLVGAWPLEPCAPEEFASFVKRMRAYVLKAFHEAKVHTSWINPNEGYDEAVQKFVARILDEEQSAGFLGDLRAFLQGISHFGLLNSLAQTLLKTTAPGVPDTYQGTELWDFSLVDPDNRRPVDFALRRDMLRALDTRVTRAGNDRGALVRELVRCKEDGRVKLYVSAQALRCRRNSPGLFTRGAYIPGETVGARAECAFGFARRHGDVTAVAIVPRFMTQLVKDTRGIPVGPAVWQDTRLLLADIPPCMHWLNLFTGRELTGSEAQGRMALPLSDVFGDFPVALLLARR